MKVLYHGTRYLNLILADQCLRRPSFGEKHVSLTTRKYVAKYFADLSRDNVFGFGYIISLDRDLLEKDGYSLRPSNAIGLLLTSMRWPATDLLSQLDAMS